MIYAIKWRVATGMYFEYKAYKKVWYVYGLSAVIIFTLIIAFLLFVYMFGNRANVNGDSALIGLMLMSIFAVYALRQTFPLRYGFPLMFEKQSELVLFSGTVEDISERTLRTAGKMYRSYGDVKYKGCIVTISGQEFFFFNAEYLSVGDEIRVSYLPKSRVVLEYKRL